MYLSCCAILFILNFLPTFSVKQTVFDRNLVRNNPNAKEILDNYQTYVLRENRVKSGVFGFVPDNKDGYEDATVYAKKFSYLSPMWFNVERTGLNQFRITGFEKNDRKWIEEIIRNNSEIRIVPRMTFKNWKPEDLMMLAISELEWIRLSQELAYFCETQRIHGLVLDIFDSWHGKVANSLIVEIFQQLSAKLRYDLFVSILMVPPRYANVHYFGKEIFEKTADYATGVVLMTLNHQSTKSIENYINAIAPIDLYRKKIFYSIELNGYETSFKGDFKNVVKKDYLEFLRQYDDVLKYDEETSGSYFEITGENQIIFYPTLQYVNDRVELANNLEMGISIGQVGDGLDYFYELL